MPKGKPWAREEEKRLRELRGQGLKASEIAVAMGKSEEAVMKKLERLGLKVVHQCETSWTTTSSTGASDVIVPKELYSVGEALGLLAGALKALQAPGLSKAEVMRYRSIIQGVKTYKELLADFMDYRGLEAELSELRKKYGEPVKKTNDVSTQPAVR